jgi:hypothetical protein
MNAINAFCSDTISSARPSIIFYVINKSVDCTKLLIDFHFYNEKYW